LTAAGIAFPGWGLFGLVALVALSSVACVAPVRAATVAVGLALFANVIYPGDPPPPDSWEGVQTTFALAANAANPLPEFQAAEGVQQIARTSLKRVIVFPEFVVPRWTEATDAFWHRTVEQVKASDKTLLIGAGLPIVGTGRYRNAVLTVGADAAPPFFERIPVPVVMWNPLNPSRSVPLEAFGPGVLQVRGERAAVLVCYEQLLTWPILHSALQRPTLIVGLANDHWARGTPIAAAQRAAVTAWARLFKLPKILAVNL
jgi:apolipoprotein N-acyltransferase